MTQTTTLPIVITISQADNGWVVTYDREKREGETTSLNNKVKCSGLCLDEAAVLNATKTALKIAKVN